MIKWFVPKLIQSTYFLKHWSNYIFDEKLIPEQILYSFPPLHLTSLEQRLVKFSSHSIPFSKQSWNQLLATPSITKLAKLWFYTDPTSIIPHKQEKHPIFYENKNMIVQNWSMDHEKNEKKEKDKAKKLFEGRLGYFCSLQKLKKTPWWDVLFLFPNVAHMKKEKVGATMTHVRIWS